MTNQRLCVKTHIIVYSIITSIIIPLDKSLSVFYMSSSTDIESHEITNAPIGELVR